MLRALFVILSFLVVPLATAQEAEQSGAFIGLPAAPTPVSGGLLDTAPPADAEEDKAATEPKEAAREPQPKAPVKSAKAAPTPDAKQATKTAQSAPKQQANETKKQASAKPKKNKKAKKKQQPKLASIPAAPPQTIAIPGAGAMPSAYLTVDGAPIKASVELDQWIDGTRVFASPLDGGFYFMAWMHPDHVRLVAGLDGRALRVEDGGTAVKTPPVRLCFKDAAKELICHDLDGFVTGQEIHFETGQRKYIRTPQDIIDMGLWPRMAPYIGLTWDKGAGAFVERGPRFGRMKSIPVYKPLKSSMTKSWMPSQGGQQAVHSTWVFARWALDPDGDVTAFKHLIDVTAAESASWPWHRMDGYRPIDLRKDYYTQANYRGALPYRPGNVDDFEEQPKRRHGWQIDGSHLNVAGWEQYLLTGDPYYLRQWQLAVIHPVLLEKVGWRKKGFSDGKAHAVINRSQPRSYGKHLMLLLRLVKAMPDGDWNWLQPKAHFEFVLNETAKQSQWLARTPGARAGSLPRSWKGERVHGWGFSHSDAQALWSIGWAVTQGYDSFRPLWDSYSEAARMYWETLGVDMLEAGPKMGQDRDVPLSRALETALASGKVGLNGSKNRLKKHVWREERVGGIFAALSQWFTEWVGPAAEWRRITREYEACASAAKKGAKVYREAHCPAGKLKWSGPSIDWQFAIGTKEKNFASH